MCRRQVPTYEDDDYDSDEDMEQFVVAREREQDLQAKRVANDPSLTDPAKIEAIAKIRGLLVGETSLIDTYLSNQLTLTEVIERLAPPIDEAYTTADHGWAYWLAEQKARPHRELCPPEEALSRYGPEEDIPEPEEVSPTAWGQLEDLWIAVLYSSKKIPWDDEAQQNKLLELVKALKERPDPPPPARMTIALERDWVWTSGNLWSELTLLGLESREVVNEVCGVGSGFTLVEQRAWTSVSAFWARLTASGTADYHTYGLHALRDGLEDLGLAPEMNDHGSSEAEIRSCFMKVAAVWILVAGRNQYPHRVVEEGGGKGDEIDLESEDAERLPWYGTSEWTDSRWTYWRRMFGKMSSDDFYTQESRGLASRAKREIATLQEGKVLDT